MEKQFAGIILAAGKAERFGAPKILVDWNGQPLIRHVAKQVLNLELTTVIVVLGAVVEPAKKAIADLPVTIIRNQRYQSGIGTSFSTGIKMITEPVDGAFIFLCDQPYVDKVLVSEMKSRADEGDVLYPIVDNKPGHPVLWRQQTFDRIREMYVGETGRSLQKHFHCVEIPWRSKKILLDIDTPEDYEKILRID